MQADEEAGMIITKADNKRRTGTWISVGGMAAFWTGLLTTNMGPAANRAERTDNAASVVMMVTGLSAMIVGEIVHGKARRLFGSGVRLFNSKAAKGTLIPISLQMKAGPTQAGIALRW